MVMVLKLCLALSLTNGSNSAQPTWLPSYCLPRPIVAKVLNLRGSFFLTNGSNDTQPTWLP